MVGGKARKVNWCYLHGTRDARLYHRYYFVGNIGLMEFFEDYFHLDSSGILEPGMQRMHRRERIQL